MLKPISIIILCSIISLGSCKKDKAAENQKAKWIENAFTALNSNAYPKVKAIAWWHENFDNSKLRVDSSPESLKAYKKEVAANRYLTEPIFSNDKLIAPATGIYHAAFPDFGGTEDMVSTQRIEKFETLVDKEITWAYFSNNWYGALEFPTTTVTLINDAGRVPFIRMMPRVSFEEGGPDPFYTMQKIIDGDYDIHLAEWAIAAKNTAQPLLVEFGTEMNGNWFPWNAQYNGADTTDAYGDSSLPDGAERFRDAYRHIIDICNTNDANNITWFFHVDAYSQPDKNWNAIENYYPGDEYIDWLGVSVYGAQESGDPYQEFSEIMNDVYPQLINLADKPIAILEFAVTEVD
ncbi:MAG TPA: hypothetical protein ENJ53_10945 [Phaeodactylibacter sp.]|nr:hypothetical protein [Phaeodactylibacter sp.]